MQRMQQLDDATGLESQRVRGAESAAEVAEALAGMERLAEHWKELCGELEEEVNEAEGEMMALEARNAALVEEGIAAGHEASTMIVAKDARIEVLQESERVAVAASESSAQRIEVCGPEP